MCTPTQFNFQVVYTLNIEVGQFDWIKIFHTFVYRLKFLVEHTFSSTTFAQILVITLNMALNIYKLSKTKFDEPKQFILIFYFTIVMFQLFFYCWFGNEVLLQVYNNVPSKVFVSNFLHFLLHKFYSFRVERIGAYKLQLMKLIGWL